AGTRQPHPGRRPVGWCEVTSQGLVGWVGHAPRTVSPLHYGGDQTTSQGAKKGGPARPSGSRAVGIRGGRQRLARPQPAAADPLQGGQAPEVVGGGFVMPA